MKASVLTLIGVCFSSWLLMAVSPAFGATLPELVDSLEGAAHNTPEAPALAVADAKSDLLTLQDRLDASYAYEKYYESRWHFQLHEVVARKLIEVDQLAVNGMISNADFRSLVSETVSTFRDAHTWISTKGNAKLSLNIGLAYGEAEKQYLMYKANPEIYAQLGVGTLEEFQDKRFVMTALNDIPMPKVVQALSPVLAYSNSVTRRSYAGILLSSSKGLLYLSSLMKRGKFPMSDEVLKLTLQSRKTGETKIVTVHPQQIADWGTDDLINRVEGRSGKILPADETSEAYAAAYGWKFDETKPGVFVMTVPSWAGDLNHSDRTVRSRQALYQFVVTSMAKVQSTPDAELILDVRGNRGGDVILWQPIIQKLMSQKAQVTGVIQLNADALQTYSQYRNLTTEESIAAKDHRDYLNFVFAADDANLNPDVRAAVDSERTHLQKLGKLLGDRIEQDARFSKLLYVTTEKKDAGIFQGHVSVIADRFSFSANDTFVAALRAVVPIERLTVYGERPESGSGTAGHILLPNSKMSVPAGTFASFNVEGDLFEMDLEKPDVRMVLPIDSYFVRARWYLENIIQDIATQRDARAFKRAKENRSRRCARLF